MTAPVPQQPDEVWPVFVHDCIHLAADHDGWGCLLIGCGCTVPRPAAPSAQPDEESR